MTDIITDVRLKGILSAYVVAPFDEGKEKLEGEGFRIISLEEMAKLRILSGRNADISIRANWTRESGLYVPDKGFFLTKKSPIMKYLISHARCPPREINIEFFLNNSQVEEALSDSVELKREPIPTNRFGEDPVTIFAFGQVSGEYGEFLRGEGVNEMRIFTSSEFRTPWTRQAWIYGFDGPYRSDIDAGNRDQFCNYRVRGIKDEI